MATIEKRGNNYRITVACGCDLTGKQIRRRMTYKPDPDMTERQIEKEVQRQAVLFEEKCQNGQVLDENIRFSEFAELWFSDRKKDLRPKTYERYLSMLPRINAAIGHMKLCKIKPPHLRAFYKNLAESGIRLDTSYKCNLDIAAYLKENKLTMAALARIADVPATTLTSLKQGKNVSRATAERFCKGMNMPLQKTFSPVNAEKPLSSKTILHHHRLISSILSTAVKWGVIFSNPCERTEPPKVEKTEPKYLDEVQAATLLDLLENESIEHKTIVRLLLFTGLRRGELLGLKWGDIDFEHCTMQVCRSSLYLPDMGIFEDKTKNDTSNRIIKLSQSAVNDLKKYKVWQMEQRLQMGDRWHETEYIFTTKEGKPIHPDYLSNWFSDFMRAHSDKLPYITLHSLRHTNATLQIAGGIPLTTVAKRLGHANTVTTSRVYAHAIKSADEAAAETLENLLAPNKNRKAG